MSYEQHKQFALNLGWNPGRKDVYEDKEIVKELPHFKVLKKVFRNSVSRPGLPYYTQMSDLMQKYINSALSGKNSPENALRNVHHEVTKIIDYYEK